MKTVETDKMFIKDNIKGHSKIQASKACFRNDSSSGN